VTRLCTHAKGKQASSASINFGDASTQCDFFEAHHQGVNERRSSAPLFFGYRPIILTMYRLFYYYSYYYYNTNKRWCDDDDIEMCCTFVSKREHLALLVACASECDFFSGRAWSFPRCTRLLPRH